MVSRVLDKSMDSRNPVRVLFCCPGSFLFSLSLVFARAGRVEQLWSSIIIANGVSGAPLPTTHIFPSRIDNHAKKIK
eukprot:846499-Rhodomonas_salina.1